MSKLGIKMAAIGRSLGLTPTKQGNTKLAENIFVKPAKQLRRNPNPVEVTSPRDNQLKNCRKELRQLKRKVGKHNKRHAGTKCVIKVE